MHRITWHSTLAELARTAAAETAAARRIRHGFGIASALLVFAAASLRGSPLAALAAALLALLLYHVAASLARRWYVRRAWRAWLGAVERVEVTVEATAAGLLVAHGTHRSVVPWRDIAAIREARGGVEILGAHGLLVHVPAHAFASTADAATFAAQLRNTMTIS